jgi:alkanesulfonate monooxygenase SsuD/methylene tetrahydromethanopterin reductase-like flavin-dependent oxidoreductase (luciferase family)
VVNEKEPGADGDRAQLVDRQADQARSDFAAIECELEFGAARPVADTEGFSAPHAARDDQGRGPYDHLGSDRPALRQARGSDEAAIFAGKLAIRVMLASLISQPRRSFREGADLIAGVISI